MLISAVLRAQRSFTPAELLDLAAEDAKTTQAWSEVRDLVDVDDMPAALKGCRRHRPIQLFLRLLQGAARLEHHRADRRHQAAGDGGRVAGTCDPRA